MKRKPRKAENCPRVKPRERSCPSGFTKAEAEQLVQAANRNNQALSEWIRRTVLVIQAP